MPTDAPTPTPPLETPPPCVNSLYGPFVRGFPDGSFRPDAPLTRAQLAQMLYNAYRQTPQGVTWQNSFTDVSRESWYHAAVSFLYSRGYLTGYGDNTFRPHNPITRAELTALLVRKTAGRHHSPTNQGSGFFDVPNTHWAVSYIRTSRYHNMLLGYPDGSFRPDAHITRAEAVVLINRMLNPCPNILPISYFDLLHMHFAYHDIIRASIVE